MKAQKKKNQNPLYVVKDDHVEQASGIFDLLMKKFNLTGLVDILNAFFNVLFENVKTYAVFVAISEFVDLIVEKLKLFKQFSIV